jgi:L-alanine-DL-glutamate epimerase-like enolase superfamily enzyme
MKALEEEYEALQRKVWKARPEETLLKDLKRMREIRELIGDEKALQIRRAILS